MHGKLLFAALTTAILVAMFAGTASANRSFSVEPGGAITGTAPVTFTGLPSGRRVTSTVTLRGNLHRTISKVEGSLVGTITDCRVALGEAGFIFIRVRIDCNLTVPWHVRYVGFAGSLPSITSIRLLVLNVSFRIADLAGPAQIDCLYQGNIPAIARVVSGRIGEIQIDETATVPTTTPEGRECEEASEGNLRGTFAIEPRQNLRLI